MEIRQKLSLDFGKDTHPITVFAKQNDKNSRYLEITPLNCGQTYSLEDGVTARLQLTKADGHTVFNNATITNSAIVVELTEQALAAAGVAVAEIGLYKGTALLSSQNFYIEVEKAAFDSSAPVSSDEYNALTVALSKVDATVTEAVIAAENAVVAKEAAEEAAQKANNLLASKADKSDTYTKAETDDAIESYVSENCYTAEEADSTFQVRLREGKNVSISTDAIISVDLSEKYDASNVEAGSGELTVYSEDMPIPSATFAYQRTGDFVTVALSIEFSQAEMGKTKSYQLLGLPYKNEMVTRQATITNNKNKLTVSVGQGTSTLTVLTQGEAVNLQQKEFITDTITYKIRK